MLSCFISNANLHEVSMLKMGLTPGNEAAASTRTNAHLVRYAVTVKRTAVYICQQVT